MPDRIEISSSDEFNAKSYKLNFILNSPVIHPRRFSVLRYGLMRAFTITGIMNTDFLGIHFKRTS